MKKIRFILVCSLSLIAASTFGQSNLKEGNNNFALFSSSGDIKYLIEARKFADLAFKERRDSLNYNNNLLRALVYSTLAYVDSNRTQKYEKDPINEGLYMLNRLRDDNLNHENQPKIAYAYNKLAGAYLMQANRELKNNKFNEALKSFKMVDSLSKGEINVKHNIAVLNEKTNDNQNAIRSYQAFLRSKNTSKPEYILTLANLYINASDLNAAKNTLLTGLDYFPDNKDILFDLMNLYASTGNYESIIPLIPNAMSKDPKNLNLNYLAGFSYEMVGNKTEAEKYYKNAIEIKPTDYSSNYELGLLYLKDFVADTDNLEKQYKAQEYLLKANEIDPNAINALKSLSVLFAKAGNYEQLDRVNNQLNQITSN
ncbi:tetratricopeptide repeat protein [Olivibacter sitiensis]|uniref:tetratricopeptide repeat protein n=1 Tax=Olivibacter sitiensis TaxID=376470 RepID=UPI0003F9D4CD|nr:tetratricopeptide repeat protein [Olivibacter sitiensis]